MKFSLNTLRALNESYKTTASAEFNLDKIGSQLGAVDEAIGIGAKYHGIVIAKVISCQPHPDADKLKVCTIDDGGITPDVNRDDGQHVQVVCGAANVRTGLTVAWLPLGSTVPSSFGKGAVVKGKDGGDGSDQIVMQARELRGVVSNGMLASPKEMGLGDNHEGILEIDGDYSPGTDFAEAFRLKDDTVIDIENKMFTHRPDCFGFLGLARELAGIHGASFSSPSWYAVNPDFPTVEADELPLKVNNEVPQLVPRFTAITMSSVTVRPSPVWLQVELAKVGQKSINNIVDYTNFFMLQTGQPLHAYDYDKLKNLSGSDGATIVVRNPKPSENIKLLNGKTIEPRSEAIMIATDQQLIGIGGVMGGAATEVDDSTQNIIIECASFDMYSIRRTSMAHGLFTDAVTRFTKGQSPLQNLAVLAKIVDELRQFAGAKVAGTVVDDNHLDQAVVDRQSLYVPVTVTTNFINDRLGLNLSAVKMKTLLENVEFKVDVNSDDLVVAPPFWRTDVELREDVVEEIGRLHGFDKLPLELPVRSLLPSQKNDLFTTKAEIRARLSKAGANEVLTYSFVHGDLLKKVGQSPATAFQVANALSPDLQYYRISLIPSLLDKVHTNIKAGYDEFVLFEIGKTHSLAHPVEESGLPAEFEFTALVVAANDKLKKQGAAYYQAVKYLNALVGNNHQLFFKPINQDMQKFAVTKPYDPARSALVSIKGGNFLGIVGEFRPSVAGSLKLPKYSAGFEVDTKELQALLAADSTYSPLARFPSVKQDITLKIAAETPYSELHDFINEQLGIKAPMNSRIRLESGDIYQKNNDPEHKQITFRVTFTGADRTLTDKEAATVLEALAAAATDKLQAERI